MNAQQITAMKAERGNNFRSMAGTFVAIGLMVVLLEFAVGDIHGFVVVSRSMDPTLKVGDYVLSVRPMWGSDLKGKVIAFEADDDGSNLTKRVVGESGDDVRLASNGLVYVNGARNTSSKQRVRKMPRQWQVGRGEVFVAGDNRNNSFDSLDHGPIAKSRVVGVVALRYWPPSRVGLVN